MKRTYLPLACIGTLLLAACSSDSGFPDPTGRGAIRAINAIPGSPTVGFLIQERALGGLSYANSSTPASYDDFSYDFNFDISYPGELAVTRVATETKKIDADGDHILLLTGDINAPDITVFDDTLREFADTDTVFEVRFLHAAVTLGEVDIYFEPPGIEPGTNPPAATLAYGEIAAAADYAEASYVITVTAANDVDTVHFTSLESGLPSRLAHVISIFDGDANNTAALYVRSMTSNGSSLAFVSANHPPQSRFIHGASTLETVDIYDDDLLTSLVTADLAFEETTAYFDTTAESKTYYFTPASSTATILFEQTVAVPIPDAYSHMYLVGDTDAWGIARFVADRAPVSISARIRIFHSALNNPLFDVYVVDRDAPLADATIPRLFNLLYSNLAPTISLVAGDVDLYLTVGTDKTVIAGPYQIDATLGSSIELLVVDQVDPLFAEIIDITTPPAP